MEEKDKKVIERITTEIKKIDAKKNKIFFMVVDTKGIPSGSVQYIYKIALTLHNNGYDITMLYDGDNEGVKSWLGEKYDVLKHENVTSDKVEITASDILFYQDIFSSAMNQTKDLPCKRIAILHNLEYVTDTVPINVQWGTYKIFDFITTSKKEADRLREWFPYTIGHVLKPGIDDEVFHDTTEPKKMVINIVSKEQTDINKIIKPFYWEFPSYKWVSFKDLRGLPQSDFAKELREGAITIWIDEDTNFGYSAIEAMKSGSLVVAKMPDKMTEWAIGNNDSDGNNSEYIKNCCIWFDRFEDIPKIIGNVVLSWTNDKIPSEIYDNAKTIVKEYDEENFEKNTLNLIDAFISQRRGEMQNIIDEINNKETEKTNK
jgi:hypothetical protein